MRESAPHAGADASGKGDHGNAAALGTPRHLAWHFAENALSVEASFRGNDKVGLVMFTDRIELAVEGEGWQGIADLPGILACTAANGRIRVVADDARKRLPEVFRYLHDRKIPVTDVTVTEPTLESVFIELAR